MTNLTKFDQLQANIQLYVAPIKDVVVNSKETQVTAMEAAKELKSRLKQIEELRKELKAPFKKAADEIDARAKVLEALLKEPSDLLNTKLLAWNRELEKIRQSEVARIQKEERERQEVADKAAREAMELADFESEIGNDEAAETTSTEAIAKYESNEANAKIEVNAELKKVDEMKVKGVTYRWGFELEDITKVPLEYLVLNEVLVRKLIVASSGAMKIPGIKNIKTESLTIGRWS